MRDDIERKYVCVYSDAKMFFGSFIAYGNHQSFSFLFIIINLVCQNNLSSLDIIWWIFSPTFLPVGICITAVTTATMANTVGTVTHKIRAEMNCRCDESKQQPFIQRVRRTRTEGRR